MPTPFKQVADNATAVTSTDLSSPGATSLLITNNAAANFPVPGNGYYLTLWNGTTPGADPNSEKVLVSVFANDTFTISPTVNPHASPCNIGLLDVSSNIGDLQTAVSTLETDIENGIVDLSSNQTVGGQKSFSNPIAGSITGNAATATSAAVASALNSATSEVVVNGSTAPTAGQILTAIDANTASWQTLSGDASPATFTTAGIVKQTIYNVFDYGATGNTKLLTTGAISASSNTLTCTGANFTNADVGKVISVAGAGAGGVLLVTTIVSYISATSVTIATAASTIVSAANVYYGTDDTAAINSAIVAASAAGGGTVWLPPGNYSIATTNGITPKNKVNVIGSGTGATVVFPYNSVPAFYLIGSSTKPLTDCYFGFMSINGINHVGNYNVQMKAYYFQYVLRCTFEHLHILNTGATGLGTDYLLDCYTHDVIAENCGRLGTNSSPGAAGIGIGVNSTFGGSSRWVNCVTRNNANDGLFFESEDGTICTGYSVVNHFSENNGTHGIADAGCDGLRVIGGLSRNNGSAGFAVYAGTVGTNPLVTNTVVEGLVAYGNLYGMHYSQNGSGILTLNGCRFYSNTSSGIIASPNGSVGYNLTGLIINNCEIFLNAYQGIRLGNQSTGSGFNRLSITNNLIYNNGTSGTSPHGIELNAIITDGRISGNRIFDDQATQTQTYAIAVLAGSVGGNFAIIDNDLRENSGGAFSNAGTISSSVYVANNAGLIGVTKSSAYTMQPQDQVVYATGTTTITFPTAVNAVGTYTVKNIGSGTVTAATTS